MSRVFAVDPGPVESAWVLIDEDRLPWAFAKEPNALVRGRIYDSGYPYDVLAIEMVASYGMPVGAEVFETCVEIGRFAECAKVTPRLVYRSEIKLHHCHSSRAKDSNVIQALVDRFAKGEPNKGKGTKANPGFFYGFSGDIWQAYAAAVYAAETTTTGGEAP